MNDILRFLGIIAAATITVVAISGAYFLYESSQARQQIVDECVIEFMEYSGPKDICESMLRLHERGFKLDIPEEYPSHDS